jgi:hypothetical protein
MTDREQFKVFQAPFYQPQRNEVALYEPPTRRGCR